MPEPKNKKTPASLLNYVKGVFLGKLWQTIWATSDFNVFAPNRFDYANQHAKANNLTLYKITKEAQSVEMTEVSLKQ